ncbi:hypothetical protein BACCIP111895_03937 [Neobacillus rhizosphaerae]|uniref:GNAT family N-acetyltransferase n=1 Tax=Neobacillus rhizosphaerae TaxID=2880965 RepID=A0ABN8KVV5_9BACI|nr:N-acetyltransferase [Neobacillus rhizosphaerae]CAH2716749.1 hypothetical protein BACCIP111895_03937 [Neobacillus rhizosphaerae]
MLGINFIPWDSKTFGIKCYDIVSYNEEVLKQTDDKEGHFTIKVNPLSDKSLLQRYGFYYVDTLIQPNCEKDNFKSFKFEKDTLRIDTNHVDYDLELFTDMFDGLFRHGRFHRDFNINNDDADKRYMSWFKQIFDEGVIHVCLYEDNAVGFMAYKGNDLLLTGLDKSVKGKGLAKYFWSESCKVILNNYGSFITSVSATNLAALNLYNSLGFKFNNPIDVYHKFNS